ncbi:MAG: cupin, partial [Chloroflexota bacterium]|nr:cupin [Chloroflexota bacterium]
MAKLEREFFPVEQVDWTPAQGGLIAGLYERILASDHSTGVATRMLRFDPGTNTSLAGPQTHDFWEEVYIVEG